jgi:NitT/TauT family transport system permease protein/taurine transport system permease protein
MNVVATSTGTAPIGLVQAGGTALKGMFRKTSFLMPFVALVAIWWAVKIIFDLSDRVLVSPAQVAVAMWTLFSRGILADYAASSLYLIGIGVLVSAVMGIPLGFAIGSNKYMARSLGLFLRFFQGVSGISWLPLAVIWFGFTDTTVLVIVVYTLVVPVIFNTMLGVRAIPKDYALALRSLGASRMQIVKDIYLPGALPSIVVGLRLGMGYGWRALIAAEMLVRQGGLGDLIFGARTFGQIDRIISGMIVIGVLYIVVDRLIIQPIENLTFARWGVLRR